MGNVSSDGLSSFVLGRSVRSQVVFLFYLVAALVTYNRAILVSYAWSDDYPTLVNPQGHIEHTIKDLRPGYALLLSFFSLMDSIEDLRLVRLIGILSISITSYYLWKILKNHDMGWAALFGPLLAVNTPPFSSLAYFSVAFGVLIAQSLAVYAFYLSEKQNVSARMMAYFFLIIAMLIYPLSSLLFLAVALIVAIYESSARKLTWIRLISTLGALLISGVVAYIVGRIALILSGFLESNERAKFLSPADFVESLKFYISRHLVQSFRFFLFDRPSNTIIALQALLVCFGVLLSFLAVGKTKKELFRRIFILLVGLSTLMCPLLLFGYNQVEPRFFVSTSLVLSLVCCRNLEIWLSKLRFFFEQKRVVFSERVTIVSLISAICLFSGTLTMQVYNKGVFPITNSTNRFLNTSLALCAKGNMVKELLLIPRTEPWPSRPYLGMFSQASDLASEWVPRNALTLKIRGNEWSMFSNSDISEGNTQETSAKEGNCSLKLDDFRLEK